MHLKPARGGDPGLTEATGNFAIAFHLRLQKTKTHYCLDRQFSVQKTATVPQLSGTLPAVTQLGSKVPMDGPGGASPANNATPHALV